MRENPVRYEVSTERNLRHTVATLHRTENVAVSLWIRARMTLTTDHSRFADTRNRMSAFGRRIRIAKELEYEA